MNPETERLGHSLWAINKKLIGYIQTHLTNTAKDNLNKMISGDGIWEAGKRVGRNSNVELREVKLLPNDDGVILRCAFIITYLDKQRISHFYILGKNKDGSMNTELCDDPDVFKTEAIIAESLRKAYAQACDNLSLK